MRALLIPCVATMLTACAHTNGLVADSRDLAARVLWSRDGVAYVAAEDSTALRPGMTLELLRGRTRIATATVTRKLDGHVAVARLDGGSLAGERRLERLQLRGTAPELARVAHVRVGLPGRGRTNLLFTCASTSIETSFAGTEYRADTLRAGALRMVRMASELTNTAAAPDTIDVRFFADAADQEIALERGELDVAVFWPGELSPRMRTDPRWRDAERGVRARGVLAATVPTGDTLGLPEVSLTALNREAFAGDLLPWEQLEPTAPRTPAPVRWRVDPSLPGARLLERVLLRAGAASATREANLSYLDVPVAARDAVDGSRRPPGERRLFALRCPVLVVPALHSELPAMGGAEAFANLLRCGGSAR